MYPLYPPANILELNRSLGHLLGRCLSVKGRRLGAEDLECEVVVGCVNVGNVITDQETGWRGKNPDASCQRGIKGYNFWKRYQIDCSSFESRWYHSHQNLADVFFEKTEKPNKRQNEIKIPDKPGMHARCAESHYVE